MPGAKFNTRKIVVDPQSFFCVSLNYTKIAIFCHSQSKFGYFRRAEIGYSFGHFPVLAYNFG